MFKREDIEKIKEITKDFFQKTTFEVEVHLSLPNENTLPIEIKTEDPQILIGEGGRTLVEIQHLLKSIIKRKIPHFEGYIDLDINEYKKKKIEYLKELARSTADEVALSKQERVLPPMQSFERRIVHLELAERKDVTTESLGREPERKVVVRPYP